jgi:hypothetical protein
MRSNSAAPRSTVRQTLYPVIRLRRRRYVSDTDSRPRVDAQRAPFARFPIEYPDKYPR